MSEAGYQSVVSGCLDNLPTLNSRLVRIFISSTFTGLYNVNIFARFLVVN